VVSNFQFRVSSFYFPISVFPFSNAESLIERLGSHAIQNTGLGPPNLADLAGIFAGYGFYSFSFITLGRKGDSSAAWARRISGFSARRPVFDLGRQSSSRPRADTAILRRPAALAKEPPRCR
jgi:hypothetical protein